MNFKKNPCWGILTSGETDLKAEFQVCHLHILKGRKVLTILTIFSNTYFIKPSHDRIWNHVRGSKNYYNRKRFLNA